MDCKDAQVLLGAEMDGEIDPSGMLALHAHLDGCQACRAQRDNLRGLGAVLKAHAPSQAAPAQLRQRVLAGLRQETPAPRVRRWNWAWINFGAAATASAACAALLALQLAVPSESERLDQEIVASHFRSLLADHLTDVASTDQHTVKPWFTGKLDFAPPVVDLAAQGYPLVGGRLEYLQQRTAAALAYRHRQHLINLFIWPATGQADSAPKLDSRQGFQVLHWRREGMNFWAVSDLSAAELTTFGQLLR
ncbi:MAG: anti-sigma factor [Pseudomonadota bacterium]